MAKKGRRIDIAKTADDLMKVVGIDDPEVKERFVNVLSGSEDTLDAEAEMILSGIHHAINEADFASKHQWTRDKNTGRSVHVGIEPVPAVDTLSASIGAMAIAQTEEAIESVSRQARRMKARLEQRLAALKQRWMPALQDFLAISTDGKEEKFVDTVMGRIRSKQSGASLNIDDKDALEAWASFNLTDALIEKTFVDSNKVLQYFIDTGDLPDGVTYMPPETVVWIQRQKKTATVDVDDRQEEEAPDVVDVGGPVMLPHEELGADID